VGITEDFDYLELPTVTPFKQIEVQILEAHGR
ncbi:hypothetical protein Tco_0614235, partial [Tanacetum coccineum]